jgi:hypothetical protein
MTNSERGGTRTTSVPVEGSRDISECSNCLNYITLQQEHERVRQESRVPFRECPLLGDDDHPSNPYIAVCGERFDTYEEMAHHNRKHAASVRSSPAPGEEKGQR